MIYDGMAWDSIRALGVLYVSVTQAPRPPRELPID